MRLVCCIVTALLFTASAFAADIDFSRHITDLDGKDIPASQEKDAPPLDLLSVSRFALLNEQPQDPRAPPKNSLDKIKRFNLAIKIHGGGVMQLTSEEITLLKSSILDSFGPIVVGRATEILDPEALK